MTQLSDIAYVLFSRPQGETSIWLSLFTQDHGHLSLAYKGGRKQLSGQRSFQPYQLHWSMNRQQDGGWCRQLEALETRPLLTGIHNWTGMYVNELLYRLLPRHHPYPSLFHDYHRFIEQLGKIEPKQLNPLVRRFEWQLLAALGYAMPIAQPNGQKLVADQHYQWEDSSGWQQATTGILGHEIIQTATNSAILSTPISSQAMLRQVLQHRLSLISPQLKFAMRQWWTVLKQERPQM